MAELEIRVLIAEACPQAFSTTLDTLASAPGARYHVDWLRDAPSAERAVASRAHDLYLVDLDLLMERDDFRRLLAERHGRRDNAPIVLIAERSDGQTAALTREFGATAFLVRGSAPGVLLERAIRRALDHARGRSRRSEVRSVLPLPSRSTSRHETRRARAR